MVKSVDNSRTSIVIFGARGRMGARIAALAHDDPAFDVRALIARDLKTKALHRDVKRLFT